MSDTTTKTKAMIRDNLIKDAASLPDLIAKAESVDPNLAASLQAKSLIGSKSVWAPLATWAVTSIATHYGIGWDEGTSTLIASLLAYVAVIVCRYFTRSPIGGVVTAPKATTA